MKLEREVKHKSEDIDDYVLLDAVKAIGRRVRVVNRSYDIPYLAGYSKDGSTIFIDRHLPRTLRVLTRKVRIDPFLMTHEIVEKLARARVRPVHVFEHHQHWCRVGKPLRLRDQCLERALFLPLRTEVRARQTVFRQHQQSRDQRNVLSGRIGGRE